MSSNFTTTTISTTTTSPMNPPPANTPRKRSKVSRACDEVSI